MRFIILLVLLLAFAFIAWKAVERFGLIDDVTVEEETGPSTDSNADAGTDSVPIPLPDPVGPIPPSFDLVRVGRDGFAVIAGRGEPGASMEILANGAGLANVPVEADETWVVSTETPLDGGTLELSLRMTTPDGMVIESDETIVVYVPEDGERPLVVRTTAGGATEVIQTPNDRVDGYGPLSLESIDYDDSESVIFAGRADPNRQVQIFANGALLNTVTADGTGRWVLATAMAPGIYSLLVVQLGENGQPEYAIELPFERASSEQIALRDGQVIVQPGNSLWRIARSAYGSGYQYTIIYEANIDQIRDPDLIYPGQIFDVPETDEEPADNEEEPA